MYHIASDSREEKGINVEDSVAVISFRCNGLRVNPNKQQAGDSPAEQLEGGTFFRICNQCCSSVFCSLIIRARFKKSQKTKQSRLLLGTHLWLYQELMLNSEGG